MGAERGESSSDSENPTRGRHFEPARRDRNRKQSQPMLAADENIFSDSHRRLAAVAADRPVKMPGQI